MVKDITYIDSALRSILKKHEGSLQFTANDDNKCEAAGRKEVMQGKQKVQGHFFASIIPKPKDVRFYYFPLYTHQDQVEPLMLPELRKFLKGKTCFHIRGLNEELVENINILGR
jgi:hypothetical protein